MKKEEITPALNSQLVEKANKACIAKNSFTKKDFNNAFNAAIKEAGYTPAYYSSIMRKIGSNDC